MRWPRWSALIALAFTLSTGTIDPLPAEGAAKQSLTALSKPSALTAAEEASPAAQALAERFNPAMAFPTRDIWPTNLAYAWHDKPNVLARVVAKTGRVVSEYVAVAAEGLGDSRLASLPEKRPNGDAIQYFVDAPGDDRRENNVAGWLKRWREIMAIDTASEDVTQAAYPPTQYAHLFWYNREAGLLGIQYWFYYPYDDWVNRHEGDWEHINVILRGPTALTPDAQFEPFGYQFFFHGHMFEPDKVIKASSARGGEHVVVFTGGSGRMLLWSGDFSGGSYPFPAYYPKASGHAGPLSPGDDTRNPKRFIGPDKFRVVLLPEPDRLDVEKRPELSWLRLNFFAGQRKVHGNPFILDWMGRGGPPQQPGRRDDWNAGRPCPEWNEGWKLQSGSLALPAQWRAKVVATGPGAKLPAKVAEGGPLKRRGVLGAPRYLQAN